MPPGHNEFFDLRLYKLDLAVFQTERLYARKMTLDDLPALSLILRDEKAMVAYEHAFSEEETLHWLKTQLQRYQKDGVGLWAIVLKESGEMIGQCGLTMQPVEGETLLEVGYLFQRAFWHRGYAIEAASAAKRYAFEVLKAPEVCSIIRENNLASINVAIRNGMLAKKHFIHHYWGVDMPHIVFSVKNPAP
ncbi:MAG: GNAT family N-acetyltransferase [Christensenellaceae bacterium]|nr:GNAT family N-acetyltransferase [Christensenellaceae bacterium]